MLPPSQCERREAAAALPVPETPRTGGRCAMRQPYAAFSGAGPCSYEIGPYEMHQPGITHTLIVCASARYRRPI